MWKQISSLSNLIVRAQSTVFSTSILRSFSVLTSNLINRNVSPSSGVGNHQFPMLQAPSLLLNPERGFKVKGQMRRRCKDCFYIRRFDRLMVLCKTHPRHKQMAMQKRPRNDWILTDATQSKQRAW